MLFAFVSITKSMYQPAGPSFPVMTDADGYVESPLPLPPGVPAGTRISAQYLFAPSAGCPGPLTWSASHALEITLQ